MANSTSSCCIIIISVRPSVRPSVLAMFCYSDGAEYCWCYGIIIVVAVVFFFCRFRFLFLLLLFCMFCFCFWIQILVLVFLVLLFFGYLLNSQQQNGGYKEARQPGFPGWLAGMEAPPCFANILYSIRSFCQTNPLSSHCWSPYLVHSFSFLCLPLPPSFVTILRLMFMLIFVVLVVVVAVTCCCWWYCHSARWLAGWQCK